MRICDWSSDVCSSDLGMIFRKPPLVEHPEAMGGFMEDVTLGGVSFQSFAEMSVDEVVTVGRAGVLVDFPRVETGGFTLADAERMDLRPFWRLYKAEDILNWRVGRVGNRTMRLQVRDRKSVVEGKRVAGRVGLGGGRIV